MVKDNLLVTAKRWVTPTGHGQSISTYYCLLTLCKHGEEQLGLLALGQHLHQVKGEGHALYGRVGHLSINLWLLVQ